MFKIKHSSKDCNKCLFIVNKIYCSFSDPVGERLSLLIINFEPIKRYKTFVSLKYLFQFFLTSS